MLAKTEVVKIITKDNKACGIEYIKNNEKISVYADKIIANCDPLIVYKDLLKDLKLNKEINFLNSKRRAASLVSAYFIYKKIYLKFIKIWIILLLFLKINF